MDRSDKPGCRCAWLRRNVPGSDSAPPMASSMVATSSAVATRTSTPAQFSNVSAVWAGHPARPTAKPLERITSRGAHQTPDPSTASIRIPVQPARVSRSSSASSCAHAAGRRSMCRAGSTLRTKVRPSILPTMRPLCLSALSKLPPCAWYGADGGAGGLRLERHRGYNAGTPIPARDPERPPPAPGFFAV